MPFEETFRVVAVRRDGSRRILFEGQTQATAELQRQAAVLKAQFVRVLVETEREEPPHYAHML